MTSAVSPATPGGVETRLRTRDGAMLFDATLAPVADEHWFDPERWPAAGTTERVAGGRASVVFLRDAIRSWVLRHYRRGGAVASMLDDRYLWTGEDRTRASSSDAERRVCASVAVAGNSSVIRSAR